MQKRVAFTLVELVLSIVVVGVVILSIPLIVKQSNANIVQSQNVIGYFNALTLMETIRSKPWDDSNIIDYQKSGEYYILNTSDSANNCFEMTQGSNKYTKKGLGNYDRRRMCDPDKKTATSIKPNGSSTLNSINSFNGYKTNVSNGGNNIFSLETEIKYVNINFTTGVITDTNNTSDVKRITISLNRILPDGNQELVSKYTYYATNIGTNIPASKDNA